jgi:fluoroacetyl-CoA thioesterase
MEIPELTATEGTLDLTVGSEMLATAYGSGTVAVFATPALIAFMERTAMESVARLIPVGFVTVGTEVSVKHFRASLPGTRLHCHAKVVSAIGRKLIFEVKVSDAAGEVGKGTHTRYIVEEKAFIASLQQL